METTKDKLIEHLEKLPEVINEKAEEIYNKRQVYEEQKMVLKTTELRTGIAVADEVDETGKSKFSNATKREVETAERLKTNQQYKNLVTESENLKNDIGTLSLQLDFLRNKFSAAKSLVRLLTSE